MDWFQIHHVKPELLILYNIIAAGGMHPPLIERARALALTPNPKPHM